MADLVRWQRVTLLSAFAHCMREAIFSREHHDTLASGTVRGAVDDVAQTIRDHSGTDPRLDSDGKYSPLLLQQFKGYKNTDKPPKQQKAIPASVLKELRKRTTTVEDLAIGQLTTGAWFFAMRSCEYSTTSNAEKKRTKLLKLRNVEFRLRRHLTPIPHGDPNLALSDTVTITFEDQKNAELFESITMHRSHHGSLCPVRAWAEVVPVSSPTREPTKTAQSTPSSPRADYQNSPPKPSSSSSAL